MSSRRFIRRPPRVGAPVESKEAKVEAKEYGLKIGNETFNYINDPNNAEIWKLKEDDKQVGSIMMFAFGESHVDEKEDSPCKQCVRGSSCISLFDLIGKWRGIGTNGLVLVNAYEKEYKRTYGDQKKVDMKHLDELVALAESTEESDRGLGMESKKVFIIQTDIRQYAHYSNVLSYDMALYMEDLLDDRKKLFTVFDIKNEDFKLDLKEAKTIKDHLVNMWFPELPAYRVYDLLNLYLYSDNIVDDLWDGYGKYLVENIGSAPTDDDKKHIYPLLEEGTEKTSAGEGKYNVRTYLRSEFLKLSADNQKIVAYFHDTTLMKLIQKHSENIQDIGIKLWKVESGDTKEAHREAAEALFRTVESYKALCHFYVAIFNLCIILTSFNRNVYNIMYCGPYDEYIILREFLQSTLTLIGIRAEYPEQEGNCVHLSGIGSSGARKFNINLA